MPGFPQTIVLLGGGIASVSAAAALRSEGYGGRIILVSDESEPPYERPPLSKEMLTGSKEAPDCRLRPDAWYGENEVELLLETRAASVDAAAGQTVLEDGGRLSYDALLIASGGRARRLPGLEGERVFYLRALDDAAALRERLAALDGWRMAVLGGGFIGCETAASARALGAEATIIEMLDSCLQVPLGPRLGRTVSDIHRERGVELRLRERVTGLTETSDGLLVETDRGTVECGLLVVAAGMIPNTEAAAGSPLPAAGGIQVDGDCRTIVRNIFAAGDVAAQFQPETGEYRRVEHHDTAARQGAAAARGMLGLDNPEPIPHWFWSDQYDHTIQSQGLFDPQAPCIIRGSLEERRFTAFQLEEGRIRAALTVDRPRDILAARKLMAAGVPVTREMVEDADLDLRRAALAGAAA